MHRVLFHAALLAALGVPLFAVAQVPTATPDCCQAAGGWSPPALTGVAGVAADLAQDRIYLADETGERVWALDADGTPIASFGSAGSVVVTGAFAVAPDGCGGDGSVYVVRRNPGNVQKLDASGNLVWTSDALAGGIRSAYRTQGGAILVSHDSGTLYVLDLSGGLQDTLTGLGLSTGTGMAQAGNFLYIADTAHNQVVRLTQTGPYAYGSPATMTSHMGAHGLDRDLDGNFYVTNFGAGSFTVYDASWNPLSTCSPGISGAFNLAVDGEGSVYVTALGTGTVAKRDPCPFFTANPGGACAPSPTPTPFYAGADPPEAGKCFIYPSPVRGNSARVAYRMAESGNVRLRIWNMNGELAAEVTDRKASGAQVTPFDTSAFASGLYFYSLTATYDSGATEGCATGKFAVLR